LYLGAFGGLLEAADDGAVGGGDIVVLGLGRDERPLVGPFAATGQHGGRIFLRCDTFGFAVSEKIIVRRADDDDLAELSSLLSGYAEEFGLDLGEIMSSGFHVLTPDSKNPYKTLYNYN
jgi:glutamate synthase domain-containing protein 3